MKRLCKTARKVYDVIQVVPSSQRHHMQNEWLSTRYSFSFDRYYDPSNLHFGALRVFNEDVIAPHTGFGLHPHRDMEIVTYVISGELEHRDSMGNVGRLRAGEVQRMSAGTGVLHAETNPGDEPLHLLQVWFLPSRKDLPPSWEQKAFTPDEQRGRLLPVVSNRDLPGAMTIHQDVTYYLSRLEAGQSVQHSQAPGRRLYLFLIAGELTLGDGTVLHTGDTARIKDVPDLLVTAREKSELVLFDLA